MSSAAEKYGKLGQALSGEARQQVLESSQEIRRHLTQSISTGTPSRPEVTPATPTPSNEPRQRGLSR